MPCGFAGGSADPTGSETGRGLAGEPGMWQLSLGLCREGKQGQLGTKGVSPNLILGPELPFFFF